MKERPRKIVIEDRLDQHMYKKLKSKLRWEKFFLKLIEIPNARVTLNDPMKKVNYIEQGESSNMTTFSRPSTECQRATCFVWQSELTDFEHEAKITEVHCNVLDKFSSVK